VRNNDIGPNILLVIKNSTEATPNKDPISYFNINKINTCFKQIHVYIVMYSIS
jgi:hypothetical protein